MSDRRPDAAPPPASLADHAWRLGLRGAFWGLRAWWFVARPTERSAHVAVWCDDRLLLVRNSYRSGWSLPAGRLGRREDARAGALREVREEVGLDLRAEALVDCGWLEVPDHHKIDRAALFRVDLPREPDLAIDRREIVHALFVPRERAFSLALSPVTLHALRTARGDESRSEGS